jgi:hypothetical protein
MPPSRPDGLSARKIKENPWTWIDTHLYFYTPVGVIVCLISGYQGYKFSFSLTRAAKQILS